MGGGILYALVARGQVVLAEFSSVQGNASRVAVQLLAKLPASAGSQPHSRASYVADGYVYHRLTADDLTYLCMTEEVRAAPCLRVPTNQPTNRLRSPPAHTRVAAPAQAFGRRLPFSFLEDVRAQFMALYGAAAATAAAYELTAAFSPVLASRAAHWGGARADALGRVRGEVEGLREVMVDSIERVLERGERLELLVQKTEGLSEESVLFKRGAQRLRAQAWWRNARMRALMAVMCVLGVYLLAAFVCSPTLQCR
jgi:vesicle-associated membrane protein 7